MYIYKKQIFEGNFAKYMERIKDTYIMQQFFFHLPTTSTAQAVE